MDHLPGDDLRSDPAPVAKFFRSVGVVSINWLRYIIDHDDGLCSTTKGC